MFILTILNIVTCTTEDNSSFKLDALIPEDAEELNELLKREVETNIVNDNEHTLKEDQKTTHHYSMSFKEILLISITSLYFLRSEEHTSELQSRGHIVCRLLLEKKKTQL